ncbi:MAG: metallophosphoesterase [Herpetosiphonaceae bacterium]|nr:metallophosphoesterase [Herpetosiphonaceae bacterium]
MDRSTRSLGTIREYGRNPVRFLVMGDTGTGTPEQYQVAAAATSISRNLGCDFILGLGDNIYEFGVRSAYDTQFENKFEQPYRELNVPFYFVLGNHDNSSDLLEGDGRQNCNGNYQVAYHYRKDRLSNKWQMPARYYTFRYGPVQFFALDTNPLMGVDPYWPAAYSAAQRLWLEQALTTSTAAWKIVYGHHPYRSNGFHGDAGSYDQMPGEGQGVRQFLEQSVLGKADLYLAGHDHNLMWLTPKPSHGNTQLVICGAGGRTGPLIDPQRNPTFFQTNDSLGFAWFEIAGRTLHSIFYNGEGNQLFEHTVLQSEPTVVDMGHQRTRSPFPVSAHLQK